MQGNLPHTRHYIEVGDRLVHYRRIGSGPALIMQHASPLTSQSLLSAARVFAKHFTCIALDNPGYGLSDPLPSSERANLDAYAIALKDTIDALQIEHPIIYGASTGGAITHKFGCLYPDTARLLMLDTFSHMDTKETVTGYFPNVEPRSDGGHFLTYWNKLIRLFIHKPWQSGDPIQRQARDLPAESIIHNMLMQQLSAGPDYRHLYEAAIEYEDEVNIPKLKAQATINVWQTAPSYQKAKAYLDGVLPSNYIPIKSPAAPDGRYIEQLAWLLVQDLNKTSPCETLPSPSGKASRLYAKTRHGQVHVRRTGTGSDPLLLIHDWGASSQSFSRLADQLRPYFDLIIPDLPGHGDTPATVGPGEKAMPDMVDTLSDLVSSLGLSSCRALGIGGGALLATALKSKHPTQVRGAGYLACAPIRVSETDCLQFISAAPRISPLAGGVHTITAFDLARTSEGFWQWDRPNKEYALARSDAFNADRMHQTTVDILRSGTGWREYPLLAARWLQTDRAFAAMLAETDVFVPDWRVGGAPLGDAIPSIFSGEKHNLSTDEKNWGEAIASTLAQ